MMFCSSSVISATYNRNILMNNKHRSTPLECRVTYFVFVFATTANIVDMYQNAFSSLFLGMQKVFFNRIKKQ